MECLGFEPGAAGWKAQMKPWSYGGHQVYFVNSYLNFDFKRTKLNKKEDGTDQCDQIGRFIGLWAPFSLWQQLICPNLPHS